jgi:hypothetical protein
MILAGAGLVAFGTAGAAPVETAKGCACESADWNFQTEATDLLRQVQSTANALAREASSYHSYTLNSLSRESHVWAANRVKDHVNDLGERLARLQEIRPVAAQWQRAAIDALVPEAVRLAAHTQAAIEHLNDRNPLWQQGYKDQLRGIADRSNSVRNTVNLHLEMADTQLKVERLKTQMEAL